MAEKQKPKEDLVKLAGRAMSNPESLTGSDIKRMAASILDGGKSDDAPKDAKPSIASKVMAKVGDLLPSALTGDDSAKAKPAAKPKAPATKPAASKTAASKAEPVPPTPPVPVTSTEKPKPDTPAPAKPAAPKAAAPAKAAPAPAKAEPAPAKAPPVKAKAAAKAKAAPKG